MQAQTITADQKIDLFERPRVNIAQACAIALVSRRTIYYWIRLGKVEVVRTAGGALRIYADTLILPDRRYH